MVSLAIHYHTEYFSLDPLKMYVSITSLNYAVGSIWLEGIGWFSLTLIGTQVNVQCIFHCLIDEQLLIYVLFQLLTNRQQPDAGVMAKRNDVSRTDSWYVICSRARGFTSSWSLLRRCSFTHKRYNSCLFVPYRLLVRSKKRSSSDNFPRKAYNLS